MEERSGPRLVTQRQLEVAAPPADPTPASPAPSPDPPAAPVPSEPVGPSNRGLLARQLRWFRERARFESKRPDDEGPK